MSSDISVTGNRDPGIAHCPGLQTRASNILKHPGRVITDQIPHRRTHSQVIADRAAAAELEAAEAEETLRRINKVAEIQLRLEKQMSSVRISIKLSFIVPT